MWRIHQYTCSGGLAQGLECSLCMRNVGGSNPPSSTFFFPRNVTSHLSTAVIYKSYPLIFFCARWTSLLLRTYSSHTHIPWYLPGTIVPGYSSYSSTSELRTAVHQNYVQYISTTYSSTSAPRTAIHQYYVPGTAGPVPILVLLTTYCWPSKGCTSNNEHCCGICCTRSRIKAGVFLSAFRTIYCSCCCRQWMAHRIPSVWHVPGILHRTSYLLLLTLDYGPGRVFSILRTIISTERCLKLRAIRK